MNRPKWMTQPGYSWSSTASLRYFFLVVGLLAGGLAGSLRGQTSSAAFAQTVEARLEDGGRTLAIMAPGLAAFRSGFAATVEIDGVRQQLDSRAGTVVETQSYTAQASDYGPVSGTPATIRFEQHKLELLFRLERVLAAPQVVLVQAGIRNFGERPVRLLDLMPLLMEDAPMANSAVGTARCLQVAGPPEEWLLTGLHARTPDLFGFSSLTNLVWLHEQFSLYRSDGAGFLLGPAGVPTAYLTTLFTPLGSGRAALTLASSMYGIRVLPGQVRWGQQAGLFFEPPRTALLRWTEWVARTHGARTAKGALTGWSSVYSPERIARGADTLGVVTQIGKSNERLQPDVIQIGENFETDPGKLADIAALYPQGLPFYARNISAAGCRAGLKLDFALPQNDFSQCVANVRGAVQDDFSYLKLGYHQLPAFRDSLVDGDKTDFEAARENLQALRQAAGENTYILFCEWYADRATVGLVDASRTGPPTTRSGVRDVMGIVLRSYQLNGRWFAVDNDCYYMATELRDVSPVVGGWPLARTWISMVGLSCGAAFTSDLWHQERFQPYWRNVEVLTPPAKERTEVLDLGTAREWPRLVGQVRRDWGDFTVALLWNPSDKEQTVALDFAPAGLDPKKRYAVWSFWDNRYLGVTDGDWRTPFLAPGASQLLRFTELPAGTRRPVFIGSNLHIYCGAAELRQVRIRRTDLTLELTDAGAREGDLYIYSRFQPVLRQALGCGVSGITSAGENVWRVSVHDRRRGAPQRIEMGLVLPLTWQLWFWGLIVLVIASLAFAVWRYLAGLRLKREYVVEQERARIARDLHDDLGTGLTRIVMLSEPDDSGPGKTAQIRSAALELTRAMDEIVWAVNPRQDRLDRLVLYLDAHAQEFLDQAGIESRVDLPSPLPVNPVAARVRHGLFLAFKEALVNIVRHSGARRVELRLAVSPGRFVLTLEDDGKGFDVPPPEGTRPRGGNGLGNMRSRLAAIGGSCLIESTPGRGTLVTFEVPLNNLP